MAPTPPRRATTTATAEEAASRRITNLTQSQIRMLVDYDPETGIMRWLPRSPELLQSLGDGFYQPKCGWSNKMAGQPLASREKGYVYARIFGQPIRVHRLAWFWMYGEWPIVIDHINGVRDDNRATNLRSVSIGDNGRNAKIKNTNRSGVNGVHWDARDRRWIAQITRDGRKHLLAYTSDFQAAAAARRAAEREFGFHPNHGRKTNA